jgi:transposase
MNSSDSTPPTINASLNASLPTPPIIKSQKRLAREAKLLKKLKNQRTKEERLSDINKVFDRLLEYNITREMVGEFNAISNDFIETGHSVSGYVKLPELKRVLIYSLPNDKQNEIATMLRAM